MRITLMLSATILHKYKLSSNKGIFINKMRSNICVMQNFGDKMEMSSFTKVICVMRSKNSTIYHSPSLEGNFLLK